MKTRLLSLTILALTASSTAAQGPAVPPPHAAEPPSALPGATSPPAQTPRGTPPAAPPVVPAPPAAPPVVPALPSAPPVAPAPPAASGQPYPAQPYVTPPAVSSATAEAQTPAPPVVIQPGVRPYPPPRVRLPSPILHPIQARPRKYGDAGAPFALGVGVTLLWRDEDYRRYGADRPNVALDTFASYDLWAPSRRMVLAAGLAFRHDERARGELADLKENLLNAELTARVRATSWLWPHLRAGVGVVTTKVSLHDEAADVTFEDRTADVAGSFGAGFTLRTPARAFETPQGHLASLSLGILVEGGYTLAPDADLRPEPDRRGEVRRVSPGAFSAERSAAYLRILGVIRF